MLVLAVRGTFLDEGMWCIFLDSICQLSVDYSSLGTESTWPAFANCSSSHRLYDVILLLRAWNSLGQIADSFPLYRPHPDLERSAGALLVEGDMVLNSQ